MLIHTKYLLSHSCRSWKHKKTREKTLLRPHFQWLCSLKKLIQSEQQPLKSSSFCKDYPLDFNTSWPHQIENEKRENGSCFAVSSFLVCDSIHHALQSDLNDRAIWLKTRGHLRQFMDWFDADCVVFQHDYMLWFALFFVMFWLSMLYKRPKTGRFSGSRCFRFQIRELWESNCNDNSKDETSFLILAFFFSFLML